MSETTHFTIGAQVGCTGGDCADPIRVVIDPVLAGQLSGGILKQFRDR